MEFWTAVEVLRSRWYVFVPTLLLFALLGAVLVSQVKPVYKAAGKMAIRGPNTKPAEGEVLTNDFASMDRIQLLNIIADIATDSNFKDEVIAGRRELRLRRAPSVRQHTEPLAVGQRADSR